MNWIEQILDQVSEAFQLSTQALYDFYNTINSHTQSINEIQSSIQSGTVQGLNFVKFIGAFRWVVGDGIFYLFFTLTMFGLGYTIYVIVNLIAKEVPFESIVGGIKGLFFK